MCPPLAGGIELYDSCNGAETFASAESIFSTNTVLINGILLNKSFLRSELREAQSQGMLIFFAYREASIREKRETDNNNF